MEHGSESSVSSGQAYQPKTEPLDSQSRQQLSARLRKGTNSRSVSVVVLKSQRSDRIQSTREAALAITPNADSVRTNAFFCVVFVMGFFDRFRKKKPATESVQREATRHCFVLCGEAESGDPSRAASVVARVFGQEYSVDVDDAKNVVTVTHGDDTVGFLAHMPAAIPNGEATNNADGNFLWPNGKSEAAAHRSHAIVTNIGAKEQTPVQSAITVSLLALVALEVFNGIGVYWGNASVSHSRRIFEHFSGDISEDHLPVPVWLRFQPVRVSDDEIGLYTVGMKQFGLMDLEVDRCKMNLEDLFEFISNLAHYLIQSGPVIADGNTVGGSEEDRILVRHRPSMIDKDRTVYKVVFEG